MKGKINRSYGQTPSRQKVENPIWKRSPLENPRSLIILKVKPKHLSQKQVSDKTKTEKEKRRELTVED